MLVGAGRMGRHHLMALSKSSLWKLVGVVDHHVGAFPGLEGTPFSDDLASFLDRVRPQAAIVAVPPEEHEAATRTCSEFGCHVLLEKPICPTVFKARQLAREFDRRGLVLFGGHSERFHPVFTALQRHLGLVGTIHRVEALRQGPTPPRMFTGGVVQDLAIHDLDLVQRLVGESLGLNPQVPIKSATQNGETISVMAELGWSTGKARVQADWLPVRRRVISVTGTEGVLEANFLDRTLVLRSSTDHRSLPITWSDPLEREHQMFHHSCNGHFDARLDLEPQLLAVELSEQILARIYPITS